MIVTSKNIQIQPRISPRGRPVCSCECPELSAGGSYATCGVDQRPATVFAVNHSEAPCLPALHEAWDNRDEEAFADEQSAAERDYDERAIERDANED